ncbi:hypothetical protein Ae201684P_006276 [Aphanomyces euteiches]|nr:hypothetical protein Ae201684P_006276 [Aphanomyces euteiches]
MHRVSSSEMCFVTLNEERMSFALKTSGEDVQTYVHLNVSKLFSDVVIESRANNHIAFALGIANFSRALQSGKEASGVLLRLLKREGRSFLSLRAKTVDLDIIQNIPIEVVSMTTAENYREPNVPPPTVALEMPSLRSLRTITDRLKVMQKYILEWMEHCAFAWKAMLLPFKLFTRICDQGQTWSTTKTRTWTFHLRRQFE